MDPDPAGLTIDPSLLRIKSKKEASATLSERAGSECGFISGPRIFYLIYVLLILAAVLREGRGVLIILGLFFLDWFAFRVRRKRMLADAEANPLRIRTADDYAAIDDLYRREGREQPTMSDWVQLAGESAVTGGDTAQVEDQDDERYRDILRVYERLGVKAQVVVDVGANDGRAYWKFGIGKGRKFIGIDISDLLLEKFRRRIPDQMAIQADGACLPLDDSSVDFLFCTETLEHLSDPGRAVKEFGRVLKPGGVLMIQSPNAHRIRNLNPFHILNSTLGLFWDGALQKKTVHENTWHNAATYHWDFSVHDYREMADDAGLEISELRSGQFFFPRFLLRGGVDAFIRKERTIGSIPLFRMLGGDLVLVAGKRT
jgi:SAM-dependent methyltransferase